MQLACILSLFKVQSIKEFFSYRDVNFLSGIQIFALLTKYLHIVRQSRISVTEIPGRLYAYTMAYS